MGGSDAGGGVMMASGASEVAVSGQTLVVEPRFLGVALRWPLAVARDLGRNFLTASAVRPGQVVKKFFSMA